MATNARKEDRKKNASLSATDKIRARLTADLQRAGVETASPAPAATAKPAATSTKSTTTSSVSQIRRQLETDLGLEHSEKAPRKDRWDSFWKGVGKNLKAGATDSTLKNQAQYYAHNEPVKNKYLKNRSFNGRESTFSLDTSYNPAYATSRVLDRMLDPQQRVGRESNQGTIYTQKEANRDIQALDEYRARQDVRDYEADVATQRALETIDPNTKVGQIAVAASMGVARTLPSLAKDAALTATTAGLLGAAGFSKTAVRLAKEIPTLTVRTLRYYDDAFQQAIDNGATEEQAVRAAMQTALPNAAIESAGGVDALAGKIGMKVGMQTARAASAAAKVGRKPWTSYVGKAVKAGASLSKTGFEEGAEEVAQGLVERGAVRRNYDQDTLVWDINQIADDFGMGFMGGVLMGGALKMAGGVVDSTSKKQLADDIKAEAASQGVAVSDAEANQIADRVADAAVKSQTEQQSAVEEQAPVVPQAAPQEQQEALRPVQQYETNEKGETILPVVDEGQPTTTENPVENEGFSAPNEQQGINDQPVVENASEPLANAENGTVSQDFNIVTPEGRGEEYTSKFRTNTVEKMLEQQQINQEQADELDSLWHKLPNDQLEEAAEDYVEAHNPDELLNYLQDKVGKGLNTLELAIAMKLREQFQDEGKQEQAASAFQIVQNGAHMSGQMLQSVQLMAKLDPAFLQEDAKRNAEQQETKIHESRLQAVGVLGEAIAKADKGEWDGTIDVSKITPVSKGLGITATKPKVENGYILDEGLSEKRVQKLQKQVAAIYENCKDTGLSAVQWLSYLELELQAEGVATPVSGTSRMVASAMMLANMKTMLTRSLTGNTVQFLFHQLVDPIAITISNGLRSLYGVQGRRAYGGYKALAKGAKQGLATMKLAWLTDTLDVIGNKYNESIAENATSLNRMGGPSEALPWQLARFITNCVHFTLGIGDQPFRRGVEAQIADQYERGNAKAGVDFVGTGLPVTPKQQNSAMGIISKYGSNAAADFLIQAYTQGGNLSKVERIAAQMMVEASDIMQEQGADAAATYLVNDGKIDAKITSEDKLTRISELAAQLEVLDDVKKAELSELALGRNISEDQQERAEYMGTEITFQNKSTGYKLASGVRGLGRDILNWGIKEDNQAAKTTGRILDTTLHTAQPFVQVFGNQVSAVLEDTPLGAAVGLAEWASKGTGYVRGKPITEKNVTDIANRISRGIVGGTLLGLGMVFRGKDILSGEEPEDELEAAIWKQNGVIPNAFNLGGKYYDISNIGPALVILNIGAAVYDQLQDEGVDELTTRNIIMTILGACGFYALEDVTSDQGWEGIMEKMEQLGEQDFTGMATDTASNWLRQRYPQFIKQIADFRDPFKRDTSARDTWGEIKNEYTASIPGRSENLPAKRDVLGREQARHISDSTLGKVWESFFDPAQRRSKDLSNEPVLKELSDLARATDDKSLLLGNAPYKMDGYKLTGQERNTLQKTYNAGVADVITQLLQDNDYKNLNTEDKHTVIDNAETLLWYQARQQLADGSKGEYTVSENAAGKKMAEKAKQAQDAQGIDLPTYLLYSMDMSKDYSLKYRPSDEIPLKKNGEPKGDVGDVIDSGKKKGAALAIQQRFGDDLTVDQRYYLWTLQSPSGDSAWKEVKDGGIDNDYYRYFSEGWDEETLRKL